MSTRVIGALLNQLELRINKLNNTSDEKQWVFKLQSILINCLPGQEYLSEKQVTAMVDVLKTRWLNVCDTPRDYTLSDDALNTRWIELATELSTSTHTNKHFVQLLIPSLLAPDKQYGPITFQATTLCDSVVSSSGERLFDLSALGRIARQKPDLFASDEPFDAKERQRIKRACRPKPALCLAFNIPTVTAIVHFVEEFVPADEDNRLAIDRQLLSCLQKEFALRKKHDFLTTKDVSFLEDIFSRRWTFMLDEDFDQNYTLNQGPANLQWVRLAKWLGHWGELSKSYYHLLMPTLTNPPEEDIFANRLTDYPLDECIVSSDNSLLIPLDLSQRYFETQGHFGVLVYTQFNKGFAVREFDELELSRIKKNELYATLYHKEVLPTESDEQRISRRVFLQLLRLVNQSFRKIGLLATKTYSPKDLGVAETAYQEFYDILASLSLQEKNALMNQRVVIFGRARRFAEVWHDIAHEQDKDEGCIATSSKFFIKLLIDYLPTVEFDNEEITESLAGDIANWRLFSCKKCFNDYQQLSAEQAVIVNLTVRQSIESLKFQCVYGTGTTVTLASNQKKTLPKSVATAYRLLKEDSSNASQTFMQLVETVIVPKLCKPSAYRYPQTSQWLIGVLVLPNLLFNLNILLNKCLKAMKNAPAIKKTMFFDLVLSIEAVKSKPIQSRNNDIITQIASFFERLGPEYKKDFLMSTLLDFSGSHDDLSEFPALFKQEAIDYFANKMSQHDVKRLFFYSEEAGALALSRMKKELAKATKDDMTVGSILGSLKSCRENLPNTLPNAILT